MNGTSRRVSNGDYAYAERLVASGASIQDAVLMTGVDYVRLSGRASPARRRSFDVEARPQRYQPAPRSCGQETLDIIRTVADRHGVSVGDILGPSRLRRIILPRHEAMAAVRAGRPRLSLPQIGQIFGGRDHTTVINGLQRHAARMAWADFLIAASGCHQQPDLFTRAA